MPSPDIDDPDLPLDLIFKAWPETPAVFLRRKMLCYGCPIAPFHTIANACEDHAQDEAGFRAELRAAIVSSASRP